MLEYPCISKEIRTEFPIYAFDKLDGSNIRAEWSKKRGFYKFGAKTRLLGVDDVQLGEAVQLIQDTYGNGLAEVFGEERYDRAVCFFEYYGANSFAGHHISEPHQVTLFDVMPEKEGLTGPAEFIDLFFHLGIPKVLFYGKANSIFAEQVRSGTLEFMTFEGVICKSKTRKQTMPTMFKIKTRAWLDKLKNFCNGDEKLFELLA